MFSGADMALMFDAVAVLVVLLVTLMLFTLGRIRAEQRQAQRIGQEKIEQMLAETQERLRQVENSVGRIIGVGAFRLPAKENKQSDEVPK